MSRQPQGAPSLTCPTLLVDRDLFSSCQSPPFPRTNTLLDMLSILLCTGRSSHDALDYPSYSLAEESPRKKPSFSSSRKGSKISKLQIGAPSDFRHESHMGYDEVRMRSVPSASAVNVACREPPSRHAKEVITTVLTQFWSTGRGFRHR